MNLDTPQRNKKLANLVSEARTEKRLSYGQLAALTSISKGTLFKIEDGSTVQPDQSSLQRLAQALDLPLADLYLAAGYEQSGDLPTLTMYFRSKYPKMPDTALQQIADITKKYGIEPNNSGPRPGEDEI
ncbi:helix-turn-helix domain-containing protein [Flexivirga caeni]|uniref:XRE family transcriptional regulator n=1 Tax=Flexivirga caeni TaxID=2294115 RepID=A0A3M9MEM6_9MICO|nr:helix-turn-helix transcriptional regulator [Flexivirga caeni]RNI23078.1 XRE family transcriptional regulator [Flexivirga caeni]